MNASATAVLPMPGSPVTKTICRSPFDIRPRHWWSSASWPPRPTRALAGPDAAELLPDAPSVTGAMNRYPRRDSVSMKMGFLASSPSTDRMVAMWLFNTSG